MTDQDSPTRSSSLPPQPTSNAHLDDCNSCDSLRTRIKQLEESYHGNEAEVLKDDLVELLFQKAFAEKSENDDADVNSSKKRKVHDDSKSENDVVVENCSLLNELVAWEKAESARANLMLEIAEAAKEKFTTFKLNFVALQKKAETDKQEHVELKKILDENKATIEAFKKKQRQQENDIAGKETLITELLVQNRQLTSELDESDKNVNDLSNQLREQQETLDDLRCSKESMESEIATLTQHGEKMKKGTEAQLETLKKEHASLTESYQKLQHDGPVQLKAQYETKFLALQKESDEHKKYAQEIGEAFDSLKILNEELVKQKDDELKTLRQTHECEISLLKTESIETQARLNEHIDKLTKAEFDMTKMCDDYSFAVSRHAEEISVLEDTNRSLSSKLEETQSELLFFKKQNEMNLQDYRAKVESYESQEMTRQQDCESIKAQLSNLENTLESKQKEIIDLQKMLDSVEDENSAWISKVESFQKEEKKWRNCREEYTAKMTLLEDLLNTKQQEVDKLNHAVDLLTEEKNQLATLEHSRDETLRTLREKEGELLVELETTKSIMSEKDEKLSALYFELEEKSKSIETLQRDLASRDVLLASSSNSAQATIESLHCNLASKDGDVMRLNQQVAELNNQIQELSSKKEDGLNILAEIEDRLQTADREKDVLTNEASQLNEATEAANQQKTKFESDLTHALASNVELSAQLSSLTATLSDVQSRMTTEQEELKAKISELTSEINEKAETFEKSAATQANLESQIAAIESEKENLHERLVTQECLYQELVKRHDAKTNSFEELELNMKQINDAFQESRANYGLELDSARSRCVELEGQLAKMEKEVRKMNTAANAHEIQWKERAAMLEQSKKELEAKLKDVLVELENVKASAEKNQASAVNAKIKTLHEQIDILMEQLQRANEKVQEFEGRFVVEKTESGKLRKIMLEKQSMLDDKESKIQELSNEMELLKQQIEKNENNRDSANIKRSAETFNINAAKKSRASISSQEPALMMSSPAMKESSQISKIVSPMSHASRKLKVISFSGFRDNHPDCNLEMKAKLIQMLQSLGATVKMDSDFEDNITHVITPPNSRTLKTFAACLTSKWLITDLRWVFDSYQQGHFVPEDRYGNRYQERPFQDKRFYISPGFVEECKKTNRMFRVDNARNLIETLGKGFVVNDEAASELVLRAADDASHQGNSVTWNEFLAMIPGSQIVPK